MKRFRMLILVSLLVTTVAVATLVMAKLPFWGLAALVVGLTVVALLALACVKPMRYRERHPASDRAFPSVDP